MKTSVRLLVGLLICFMAVTSIAFSKEVESSILQYKLNRLYFSTGLEKYVYPDCRYIVYRGRVVLGQGLIEFSEPGVSISYTLDYPFEGKNVELLHAVIDAVDIDSLGVIRLGAAEFQSLPLSTMFPTSDFPPLHIIPTIVPIENALITNSGNRLHFKRYESLFEMALAFSGGGLDGYFSYGKPQPPAENAEFISTSANFFVAMIPNVSREFNHGGILSTAMYYRFNPDKPYVFFTGDGIVAQNCLYLCDSANHRPYPYDSEAGRQLMRSVRNRPDHLKLAVFDKQLEKTGAYFADILSRDKVRTRLTKDWYEGDMYLCFVPLDRHDPLYSLKYVYDIVSSDTIAGRQINPTVGIIGKYIESAENAATDEIRSYYIGKIDRAFKEDIGIFPLYRPTIYFIYDHHLQGYQFDPDGYLDMKRLSKITLPEIPGRR
ncbi:MAG: hypothetical protein JW763_02005 [candidate division Zixibacteria bacterium]|nr:hypothetical protein [candidate division Zixibacteria bacterium]